ncbi:MAG: hypothetical protein ACE5O2_01735, partial [Armatimonadota bacterium]
RWATDLGHRNEFEVISLVVCPRSVVAALKYQERFRALPQWFLVAFDSKDGTLYWFWRYPLRSEPLPGGLLVGRRGQVVVTMLDGSVRSFGPRRPAPARPRRG